MFTAAYIVVLTGTRLRFFAWMFGGLFGQPISSAIINRTAEPDYHGAIIFAGVLFLFGACLAVTLRIMQGGWKILVKV